MVELPKLDVIYYYKKCLGAFLFVSDIADHQNDTGHTGISRLQLSKLDNSLVHNNL